MNIVRIQRPLYHCLRRQFSVSSRLNDNADSSSYKFVVLGGGTGGLAIASHLARKFPNQVAVIEPAEVSEVCHNNS